MTLDRVSGETVSTQTSSPGSTTGTRPHLNFGDFKRVQDVHRHCVRSLIRQMPSDPLSKALARLADVDWLSGVVVEGGHAPFGVANLLSVGAKRIRKAPDSLPDCSYIPGNDFGLIAFLILFRLRH
jgi:hypothetical protein